MSQGIAYSYYVRRVWHGEAITLDPGDTVISAEASPYSDQITLVIQRREES